MYHLVSQLLNVTLFWLGRSLVGVCCCYSVSSLCFVASCLGFHIFPLAKLSFVDFFGGQTFVWLNKNQLSWFLSISSLSLRLQILGDGSEPRFLLRPLDLRVGRCPGVRRLQCPAGACGEPRGEGLHRAVRPSVLRGDGDQGGGGAR